LSNTAADTPWPEQAGVDALSCLLGGLGRYSKGEDEDGEGNGFTAGKKIRMLQIVNGVIGYLEMVGFLKEILEICRDAHR